MPFAVITSRKAKKDLLDIKQKHGDILTGMVNQRQKVEMYNQEQQQQKMVQDQNQQVMQQDMQKTQMTNDTAMAKNTMDYSLKQQELELKKIALSQP